MFAARLPYDNAAFEKMVGVKYTVEWSADPNAKPEDLDALSSSRSYISALLEADSELVNTAVIRGGKTPMLYDLSAIDEFRTDEAKVPANTFLIVDTTGATYGRVIEDTRRGVGREVIGIIPVVTTAANAMYAQQYIHLPEGDLSAVRKFESLSGSTLLTLKATNSEGQTLSIDNQEMENGGLSASDLVGYIATDSYFHEYLSVGVNVLSNDLSCQQSINEALTSAGGNVFDDKLLAEAAISTVVNALKMPSYTFSVSSYMSGNAEQYSIVSAGMVSLPICVDVNTSDNSYSFKQYGTTTKVDDLLSANGYKTQEARDALCAQFGWHGKDLDDSVPQTMALNAATFFPQIQPAVDGDGLDPEHLKDIGVVVYKAYLDPSEGNKVSYEPVEAFAGSLFKDDKDPNTGVTKFIDTIINTQSRYINFFSNCFSTTQAREYYQKECDILIAPPSKGACLGLYTPMTKKDISISKSILEGMNKAFAKVEDVNLLDIDIVPDAGVSNIASYIKAIFGEKGPYDLNITDSLGNSMLGMWTCKKATDPHVKMWKTVLMKMDNFCKNIRKDCMFTADGLRPLVLAG